MSKILWTWLILNFQNTKQRNDKNVSLPKTHKNSWANDNTHGLIYAPLTKCMPILVILEQTKATSHQNSTRRRFIQKKTWKEYPRKIHFLFVLFCCYCFGPLVFCKFFISHNLLIKDFFDVLASHVKIKKTYNSFSFIILLFFVVVVGVVNVAVKTVSFDSRKEVSGRYRK